MGCVHMTWKDTDGLPGPTNGYAWPKSSHERRHRSSTKARQRPVTPRRCPFERQVYTHSVSTTRHKHALPDTPPLLVQGNAAARLASGRSQCSCCRLQHSRLLQRAGGEPAHSTEHSSTQRHTPAQGGTERHSAAVSGTQQHRTAPVCCAAVHSVVTWMQCVTCGRLSPRSPLLLNLN